jgi:hypothetical protein
MRFSREYAPLEVAAIKRSNTISRLTAGHASRWDELKQPCSPFDSAHGKRRRVSWAEVHVPCGIDTSREFGLKGRFCQPRPKAWERRQNRNSTLKASFVLLVCNT